jgi:periplasmic divalent cation tolerance protein
MHEIVVLITVSSEDEAAKIAKTLVDARLAGCVNMIKDIRSIYAWEGKVEDESEVLMIAKTQKALFNDLIKKVKELHSYTVPEIIALPIVAGSEEYLRWLREVTG